MRDLCRKFQISSRRAHHGADCAVPAGADGADSRIHQAPPRRNQDRVRASAAGADLPRDLRHHDLPGAGDAGGAGAGGLHARAARTCCGGRWARRSPRKWPSSATTFVKGCARGEQHPGAPRPTRYSICWRSSPATASTSRTPPPTPCVAYQTAYLKANYPVEFFCAMMTNDMADTEKLSQYIAEARGMGIEVLPPDVNESQVYFAPAQSRAGVPPAQPARQPQRRTGETPVLLWPSASGWRPSRASGRSRWRRS